MCLLVYLWDFFQIKDQGDEKGKKALKMTG